MQQIRPEVLACLMLEIEHAQTKFPGNDDKVLAAGEEYGELCKALLEHKRRLVPGSQVFQEAIQLAAMAIQIAQLGTSEYPYEYQRLYAEDMQVEQKLKIDEINAQRSADPPLRSPSVGNVSEYLRTGEASTIAADRADTARPAWRTKL